MSIQEFSFVNRILNLYLSILLNFRHRHEFIQASENQPILTFERNLTNVNNSETHTCLHNWEKAKIKLRNGLIFGSPSLFIELNLSRWGRTSKAGLSDSKNEPQAVFVYALQIIVDSKLSEWFIISTYLEIFEKWIFSE